MAEKQASWIQASSHPADTDRLVLEGLLNPSGAPVSGAPYGVGTGSTDLQVTQNGTPNMSVNVAAGRAWIDGTESPTQGAYHVYNDAVKNLAISAAHATLARKDLIVAKVQDAQYSGATNAWTLAVVTGTAAGSPAEPAVPANAIVLALVDVAAAASSITNANITDRRRRACGLSGIAVCTSATRPTTGLYEGLAIYETDTDFELRYDGTNWVPPKNRGGGTLGYAPVIADQGSITTETDLTGLTVTVTVVTGRRIKVTGSISVQSTVAADQLVMRIKEGATVLQIGEQPEPTAGRSCTIERAVPLTPTPGAHTYKLSLERSAGSGTLTMKAASTAPSFILVEDIGAV